MNYEYKLKRTKTILCMYVCTWGDEKWIWELLLWWTAVEIAAAEVAAAATKIPDFFILLLWFGYIQREREREIWSVYDVGREESKEKETLGGRVSFP